MRQRRAVDEQTNCALCGMLLSRNLTPQIVTVRTGHALENVPVCADSSACRRRAIEIMRGYEKMKL